SAHVANCVPRGFAKCARESAPAVTNQLSAMNDGRQRLGTMVARGTGNIAASRRRSQCRRSDRFGLRKTIKRQEYRLESICEFGEERRSRRIARASAGASQRCSGFSFQV